MSAGLTESELQRNCSV